MRKTTIIAAVGLLGLLMVSGCYAPESPAGTAPAPVSEAGAVAELPLGINKFCDEGRAIYVDTGVKEAAIAVVENAPECGA